MGSKIERQGDHARGRRARARGTRRAHRGRPAAAGEGVGRRRRPRDAGRPRPRRPGAEVGRGQAEARAPFGDGTVFVEPYVERGRHVEVQVVGDTHGTSRCSASATARSSAATRRWSRRRRRRGLPDATRAALHDGGRAPRRGVDYAAPAPSSSCTTPSRPLLLPGDEHPPPGRAPGHRAGARRRPGRPAARRGGGRSRSARGRRRTGHAIEVRLYAEDPAADYQPQSGVLFDVPFEIPGRPGCGSTPATSPARRLDLLRRDAGQGRRATRRPASRPRASSPAPSPGARIHGVVTNRDQLVGVLATRLPAPATSARRSSTSTRRPAPSRPATTPSPRRSPSPSGTGSPARSSRASRSPGATSSASPRSPASPGRSSRTRLEPVLERTTHPRRVVGRARRVRRRRAHRGRGERDRRR